MTKTRKIYSKEFKLNAIELSYKRENIKELAHELGIRPELLYRWRKSHSLDPTIGFPGRGTMKIVSLIGKMLCTIFFSAYPNPFSNSTTIEYNLGTECELGCELRLYDVQGRVILKETLYSESGKGQLTIDLSLYGSGIYYCSLYGNRQLLQTEKLILMK